MKTNKLISSMAISLTTVFVALGITVYYSYVAVTVFELLGSGTLPIELVPYLLALPVALSTIFIIIFGLIGAHKAKNNPTGKGVFVTMAIFQMLALLCMLAASGIIIYLYIVAGTPFLEILLEGGLYIWPYLIGGIALFIAFVKNCSGMKAPKNQENVAQARPVPPPPPVPPMYNNQ